MRRIVSILLIFVVLFSFVACRNHDNKQPETTEQTQGQTEETTEPTQTETENEREEGEKEEETTQPTDIVEPTQPIVMPTTPPVETTEPTEPIKKEDTLFTFNIDGFEFYFGVSLAEVIEHVPLSGDYYDTNELIEAKGTKSVYIRNNEGHLIEIGLYNETKQEMAMKDCAVWYVSIEKDSADEFFFSPTEQSIDFDSSHEEVKELLGSSTMRQKEDTVDIYMWIWKKSKGQGMISIGIAFDKATGKIEYMYLAREVAMWD